MEAERLYTKQPSRTIQQKRGSEGALEMVDNRPAGIIQAVFTQSSVNYVPQWLTVNKKQYSVGGKMEAKLAFNDPIYGSSTSQESSLEGLMAALKERYSQNKDVKLLKGHLLNHDLGGRAIPENLFPITYEANSKHKTHVEHPVETMLYKSKNKDQYVHYIVNVDVKSKVSQKFYPQIHPKCELKCEWCLKDKNDDKIIDKDDEKIVSSAGHSKTYKKRDSFNKIDRQQYLKKWGHNKTRDLNHTYSRYIILPIKRTIKIN